MNDNKQPVRGRLKRKLVILCSTLVIATSIAIALIVIMWIKTNSGVNRETGRFQNRAVKNQSQEALSALNNENMLNTITLAAKNVDGEFWTMRHDFSILAGQVQDFISELSVGKEGFSIMVSDSGQLVYSPKEDGELEMINDMSTDIRSIDNVKLRTLIFNALDKEKGLGTTEIDGKFYYAAYARLDTLGWTMITFVPESELEEPIDLLLEELDEISEEAGGKFLESTRHSAMLLLTTMVLLIIISFAAAVSFSGRISRPINVMTEQIEKVTGDRFVFEMDEVYHTGDEIEILARTFETLSDQMEGYVKSILAMSAEKERFNMELELAARIQSDMLPRSFPAFPDRHEFDIYASMTPAREVGGDFYDYFFVDDDHLALNCSSSPMG